MKTLRLLALIMTLNLSYAHANNETGFITQMIVSGAKRMVIATGIFVMGDGIVEMIDGESLLPSFAITKRAEINGACKVGLGAVLFVAGQPSQ